MITVKSVHHLWGGGEQGAAVWTSLADLTVANDGQFLSGTVILWVFALSLLCTGDNVPLLYVLFWIVLHKRTCFGFVDE